MSSSRDWCCLLICIFLQVNYRRHFFFLFNSVFVIRLGMITHASTLIILDITTASYNDCSLRVQVIEWRCGLFPLSNNCQLKHYYVSAFYQSFIRITIKI